jgi:hypothetical protein
MDTVLDRLPSGISEDRARALYRTKPLNQSYACCGPRSRDLLISR